jgi:hypothetical protein
MGHAPGMREERRPACGRPAYVPQTPKSPRRRRLDARSAAGTAKAWGMREERRPACGRPAYITHAVIASPA